MGALQYVKVPGYAALLLRRTYADLSLPGALMDRAFEWLGDTDAHWDEKNKVWTFPSGATLTFGYLEVERDKYRYQSSEFQYVGFDELTQFLESQYTYLFSRLRRLKSMPVPIRMRSASNPGGIGHEWCQQHFPIDGNQTAGDIIFVPAKLDDNPHIDKEAYEQALSRLDYVTREQLRNGNWNISASGGIFLPDRMHTIQLSEVLEQPAKFYAACDPLEGASDFASIVTLLVLPDGRWVPFACDMAVENQSQTIDKIIDLHSFFKYDKVWIEANSLGHAKSAKGQSLFEQELRKRQLTKGVTVPYEFIWNSAKKEDRIRSMEPFYSNGQLAFLADWRQRYPTLVNQLRAFPSDAHDDGCFVENTKIATLFGNKNIQDIRVGDFVLTPSGVNRVIACKMTGIKTVIERVGLTGTPGHPVFTDAKAFVPLKYIADASEVNRLCLKNQMLWAYRKLLYSMALNTGSWDRNDITLASQLLMKDADMPKDFTQRFMNFIAERRFQEATSFIIKMATRLTTILAIWGAYRASNILKQLSPVLMPRSDKISFYPSPISQLSGTGRQKESNGTDSMQRISGRIQKFTSMFANVVGSVSKVRPSEPGSALIIVDTNYEKNRANSGSRESALSAEMNLRQTGLHTEDEHVRHVQDVVPEYLQQKPVYNLTVDGTHVYFANNVLVSNCDALAMVVSGLLNNQVSRPVPVIVPQRVSAESRWKF